MWPSARKLRTTVWTAQQQPLPWVSINQFLFLQFQGGTGHPLPQSVQTGAPESRRVFHARNPSRLFLSLFGHGQNFLGVSLQRQAMPASACSRFLPYYCWSGAAARFDARGIESSFVRCVPPRCYKGWIITTSVVT